MTLQRPIGWLVAALVIATAIGGEARQEPATTRAHRFLMGTSMTVEASGGTDDARNASVAEAFGAIAEIDRLMSNYRPDSELSTVNQRASHEPVVVSDPLLSVLGAAEVVSARSHGAFDVTVGPLMRLWGFYQKQPHVPGDGELTEVMTHVGYQHVRLQSISRSVRFDRPGVELDLGGIAKGFAVEIAGKALARRGLSGYIDAGGNQYFVGRPVEHPRWQVGIENPEVAGALLGVLDVPPGAVSTSGGYHNFFVVGGRRYGHIIDPRTGRPSSASLSVTIVAEDATLADALTKPAFVLGPVEGMKLVESFPGAQALIAWRDPGGHVQLAMSQGLRAAYRAGEARPAGSR
jgi:thiamine biosynthesis lipoprotein